MRYTLVLALGCFALIHASPAPADTGVPSANLTPLSQLIGTWKGTGPEGQGARVSYQLTSGGTGITETLTAKPGKPAMTSVYHLDGKKLMMTHYCSLGNQPRMRAQEYREGDKTLTFFFVDATNLASPADMHMHQVKFEFTDRGHFTQTWTSMKDGKEMPPHVFKFERVN